MSGSSHVYCLVVFANVKRILMKKNLVKYLVSRPTGAFIYVYSRFLIPPSRHTTLFLFSETKMLAPVVGSNSAGPFSYDVISPF